MQIDEEGGAAGTAASATETRGASGSASGSGAETRDRARSANRVTSTAFERGKGKGDDKGASKGGKRGKQTHTVSDPASLTHAVTRRDLLAFDKAPTTRHGWGTSTWMPLSVATSAKEPPSSRPGCALECRAAHLLSGWPTRGTSTPTRCGDTTSA